MNLFGLQVYVDYPTRWMTSLCGLEVYINYKSWWNKSPCGLCICGLKVYVDYVDVKLVYYSLQNDTYMFQCKKCENDNLISKSENS